MATTVTASQGLTARLSKVGPWALTSMPNTPPLTPPETPYSEADDCFDHITVDQLEAQRETIVAVIGTGYVGLHLVEAFSTAYKCIAFDIQEKRIQEVKKLVEPNVQCTSDPSQLSHATHFLISVSTVLDTNSRTIDTSCIRSAIQTVTQYAQPGSTIVFESSVAVGMTREFLEPLMTSKGLKCGMSPERVDPGRTYPRYDTIPKIISGLDENSLSSIQNLYSRVFTHLVPVSCPEVAEMTKLYENCQRMMCIAYANEMADACDQLSKTLSAAKSHRRSPITIDPWEVTRAAATKPFGYMPYTPSLGVGGHCIPVNPFYLLSNADFPLLEACTKRMSDRPARVGDRIMESIGTSSTTQQKKRPRVLVVGMGFKRGQAVLSNSPGKALAVHLLSTYDVHVEFADPLVEQSAVPFVPRLELHHFTHSVLATFDAIVVAVDQPGLDLRVVEALQAQGKVVVEWFTRR